jgi:hypothetical protein
MANSKNLLFLLLISATQVSAFDPASMMPKPIEKECDETSRQCCWVVNAYKRLGGNTELDAHADNDACCRYQERPWYVPPVFDIFMRLGLPGVTCRKGKVIKIDWADKDFAASFPADFGHLPDLETL